MAARIRPKLTEQVMLCRACDTPNRESSFNSATGRGGFGQQGGDDPWATQGGAQTGGFGTDEIPF